MKFVSKYKKDLIVLFLAFAAAHYYANQDERSNYPLIVTFIPISVWIVFVWYPRRATLVERWKRRFVKDEDVRRDEGTWLLGKPYGKGRGWSYYPKGYKFGFGHPWYKKKDEKRKDAEDPSQ